MAGPLRLLPVWRSGRRVYLRLGRYRRSEVRALYTIPGVTQVDGAAPDKVLRLAACQLDAQSSLRRPCGAESAQRAPDIRGKPEGAKATPSPGNCARHMESLALRLQREDNALSRLRVRSRRAAPRLKLLGEGRAFRVVPVDAPSAGTERHEPCVVESRMSLVLGVFGEARHRRLANVLVHPVVVRTHGAPAGVPAVLLLCKTWVELAVGDNLQCLALSRTKLQLLPPCVTTAPSPSTTHRHAPTTAFLPTT